MKEKPNYYAIIPASVRYDNELSASEKIFYGEIVALSTRDGECTASNTYFSKLYSVVPSSISNWVKHLEKKKYITIEYVYKGKEIEQRIIKIIGIQNTDEVFKKIQEGIQKKQNRYSKKTKENNTSNNNTSNNNIKEIYKEKFRKPTIEELKDFTKEHNLKIDEEYFMDYYNSNGWMVGKSKMKDWKATVRNWNRRNNSKKPKEGTKEKLRRILGEEDE